MRNDNKLSYRKVELGVYDSQNLLTVVLCDPVQLLGESQSMSFKFRASSHRLVHVPFNPSGNASINSPRDAVFHGL